MRTLIIDNYDSFTFNLYQYIAEISGCYPLVIRNDMYTYEEIQQLPIDHIIISPGPGHPERLEDFGVCQRVIQESSLPILGICLGHQGLASAFGGRVVLAPEPMHGRISRVKHGQDPLFSKIPISFDVVRYHSWIVERETLPTCLQVIAETTDGLIMGLRHRTRPLYGVQYHPESICSEYGKQLLKNFLSLKFPGSLDSPHSLNFSKSPKSPKSPKFLKSLESLKFLESLKSLEPKRSNFKSPQMLQTISQISEDPDFSVIASQASYDYELSVKCTTVFPDSTCFFEQVFADHLADHLPVVWLDSSRIIPDVSRFSIMGCLNGPLSYALCYDAATGRITQKQAKHEKYEKHKKYEKHIQMDLFDFLQQELKHYAVEKQDYPFQFYCGFVGYLGYEMFQNTLPVSVRHASPYPDAQFLFLDRAIVFDHQEKTCYLLALHAKGQSHEAEDWFTEMLQHIQDSFDSDKTAIDSFKQPTLDIAKHQDTTTHFSAAFNQTKAMYLENVQACLQAIQAGESYEICLTNQYSVDADIEPFTYYKYLRHINPAPYAAFLKFDDLAIASASIERFLHLNASGEIETKPIKGTLPRGSTPEEDERLKHQLQSDVQYQSENLMIVDLLRNDLGQVCEKGTVHVPKLMQVESYVTVHQLVSTICGRLRSNMTAIDCIRAAFPGGSMTGAPKIRSVEILQQLETEARGIYSGSIGYLSLNGAMDLNIVIRTAVITKHELTVGVGGAIIALSQPEQEYEEMLLKAHSLQQALNKFK